MSDLGTREGRLAAAKAAVAEMERHAKLANLNGVNWQPFMRPNQPQGIEVMHYDHFRRLRDDSIRLLALVIEETDA